MDDPKSKKGRRDGLGNRRPTRGAWNNQMYRVRVFDELVYDNDPNLTNVLIGEDWKIWRIDYTRAFRTFHALKDAKDLVRCDRQLLERLKALKESDVAEKTKPYLSKDEVKAVIGAARHYRGLLPKADRTKRRKGSAVLKPVGESGVCSGVIQLIAPRTLRSGPRGLGTHAVVCDSLHIA
jgi:hypothetical protein